VKRRVGWVRNDGNSDLYLWYHDGNRFWWDEPQLHEALNTTSPATTATTLGLSNQIPPDATQAALRALSKGDGTSAVHYVNVRGAQQSKGVMVGTRGWAAHSDMDAEASGVTPVSDAGDVTYITGASAQTIIRGNGWVDPR
jgi:hypothetical protein